MAVIYPFFLQSILRVHTNIQLQLQVPYPFFDPACTCYEALRSIAVDGLSVQSVLKRFGLTEYGLSKSQSSFRKHGMAGLIGLNARQFVEDLPLEVERMVFVLKRARAWILATKTVILLKGFNHDVNLALMRHLYASYGWALGTREYKEVDFYSLNLKVQKLCQIRAQHNEEAANFFRSDDILQKRLEIFRSLGERGITSRRT